MNKLNQKIPEGWSVKKLGETCFFFNGKAHENCVDENGKYVLINSKFISSNGQVCKRVNTCLFPLIENDITIVMSDVPNGKAIAKCFLVNEADKYTLNQRIGCLRTKQAIPQYLVNIISRNKYFLKFDDGINQTNLRKDQILNCPLLLPPLAEQERIADILGTWDEAIEKLSNLIEQKKLLKKGLMQKLLTGKTRLSGFTQPWKEVKLGEICTMFSGGTPLVSINEYYENGNIPFIRSGEISSIKTELYITELGLKESSAKMVNIGDLLYALYGATSGETAISKIHGAINQAILCIKSSKIVIKYLYYILLNRKNIILAKYLQGGQGNLSADIIKKLHIIIPSDMFEQQAIADVLSTADDEINLLNQKLEALKEQKKGLMQQLLTGQIRVKVN